LHGVGFIRPDPDFLEKLDGAVVIGDGKVIEDKAFRSPALAPDMGGAELGLVFVKGLCHGVYIVFRQVRGGEEHDGILDQHFRLGQRAGGGGYLQEDPGTYSSRIF
jgi:hypothetical protein